MYKEEREKDRRKEGRKDEEGRRRKRGAKLAAFQYASEMECKNRNCKMCNCKLGWTNAGIASDVSRRLFHNPPLSFLRGFLPTLRNGLRDQSLSLSSTLLLPEPLARSFQWSRKRISRRFHHEIFSFVHKWYDCAAMQLLKCHFQRKINVLYLLPISYFQSLFPK